MQSLLPTIFALAVLTGCAAPASDAGSGNAAGEELTVEFTMENSQGVSTREFGRDDVARFVFRVQNDSTQPQRLSYTQPPHRVSVVDAGGGEPVWEAHYGRMFPQVMQHQELSPGELAEFSVEWDFHHSDPADKPVPPGEYEVRPEFHGFIDAGERKLPSRLEPVRVVLTD